MKDPVANNVGSTCHVVYTWIHCPPIQQYLLYDDLHKVLGQPKQQVDVTQADDGDIQSESIEGQLSKGFHMMMGIPKEKSLRTHHQ